MSTQDGKSVTRRTTTLALAIFLMAVLSVPMAAQQSRVYREGSHWVEEVTGTLPASSNLTVKLAMGSVSISGGAQQNVSYVLKKQARTDSEAEARRLFAQLRLSASNTAQSSVLQTAWSGGKARKLTSELTAQVPRGLQLVKVTSEGGNESVTGIGGRVELSTGGGNVHVDDIGGPIIASTGGGNVTVGSVNSDLTVSTGGGNIRVNSVKGRITTNSTGGNIVIGMAGQAVSAHTGGGGIDVRKCGGELQAQTGGGTLDLGQIAGRATLRSGGGSIRLNAASGPVFADTGGGGIELYGLTEGAQVQTGGGQIVAEFLGNNFQGSTLQTPAGDIVIYLGPALKANIRGSVDYANGHRIKSDFPEIKVATEGGQYGPQTAYAEGALNGGGPVLRVRTNSGDIEFRRAKK